MKSKKENQDIKIIVDGNNIVYSAYYSFGDLSYEGERTGIIFGFLKKILTIAKKFHTNNFIFCWDSKPTWRHIEYDGYKEGRNKNMDPEERQSIIKQAEALRKVVLPRLGFKNNFKRNKFESDDLMAAVTYKLNSPKTTILVSTDNDMFQCLNHCRIFNPTTKKIFTKKDFTSKYRIPVDKWVLAKSMGGCNSDRVKGIVGVADPKSPTSKALKYLNGELTKGKIYEKIISKEGQSIIKRNIQLINLPHYKKIHNLVLRDNDFDRKKFIFVFDKYRFNSFLTDSEFEKWETLFLKGGKNGKEDTNKRQNKRPMDGCKGRRSTGFSHRSKRDLIRSNTFSSRRFFGS